MKNIYVGNLSFDTTEQDVRSLFEPYGTVDRVNIVTYRDTGQPRGFALSKCPMTPKEIIAAINAQDAGSRIIVVNEARPKTERRGGGRRSDERDRFGREAARN